MRRGHPLIPIGSELSAGIRNVYVHDCTFINAPEDPPQHVLIIKANRRCDGFVENIHIGNVRERDVQLGTPPPATRPATPGRQKPKTRRKGRIRSSERRLSS
ncbi:MAG: hypothetical protein IAE82_04475 [Opitutaceae bacterium]|nr:hypothetical protein [Opitutaceae bacterium]